MVQSAQSSTQDRYAPQSGLSSADSANAARDRRRGAVAAGLLGIIVILGVGFGPGIAHNAAHDTRHTLAFPCH